MKYKRFKYPFSIFFSDNTPKEDKEDTEPLPIGAQLLFILITIIILIGAIILVLSVESSLLVKAIILFAAVAIAIGLLKLGGLYK